MRIPVRPAITTAMLSRNRGSGVTSGARSLAPLLFCLLVLGAAGLDESGESASQTARSLFSVRKGGKDRARCNESHSRSVLETVYIERRIFKIVVSLQLSTGRSNWTISSIGSTREFSFVYRLVSESKDADKNSVRNRYSFRILINICKYFCSLIRLFFFSFYGEKMGVEKGRKMYVYLKG